MLANYRIENAVNKIFTLDGTDEEQPSHLCVRCYQLRTEAMVSNCTGTQSVTDVERLNQILPWVCVTHHKERTGICACPKPSR
jgi:hypothetical protein